MMTRDKIFDAFCWHNHENGASVTAALTLANSRTRRETHFHPPNKSSKKKLKKKLSGNASAKSWKTKISQNEWVNSDVKSNNGADASIKERVLILSRASMTFIQPTLIRPKSRFCSDDVPTDNGAMNFYTESYQCLWMYSTGFSWPFLTCDPTKRSGVWSWQEIWTVSKPLVSCHDPFSVGFFACRPNTYS